MGRDSALAEEVQQLPSDRHRAYWALRESSKATGRSFQSASDISEYLAAVCGIALSRQKVASLLDKAAGDVRRKRLGGKRLYELMTPGEQALIADRARSFVVEPSNGLRGIRQLENLLQRQTGIVRVCDPYIDKHSLDFLGELRRAREVRILTHNIRGDSTVRRDLAALNQQMTAPVEIRVGPASSNHDRFIVSDTDSFTVGASLNGFGKKRTIVTLIDQPTQKSLCQGFDREWHLASRF